MINIKIIGTIGVAFSLFMLIKIYHFDTIKDLEKDLKVLENNVSNQAVLNAVNIIKVEGNTLKEEHLEDVKEYEDETNKTVNVNSDIGTHTIKL
jgi:coenzyme F420-reducing hydrogenase gamma subunit